MYLHVFSCHFMSSHVSSFLLMSPYDGKFLKENEVFHHTFCIIIRTIMKLECFQWTNCLQRYLVHTILSYSDLKCNVNYAIHMKTRRIFSEFLLTLLSIFLGQNSKKATHRKILYFGNKVPL